MEKVTFEQAAEAARKLLEPFRPQHPRIKVFVGFEVEPTYFAECPHYGRPEWALEQAKFEDG